jgi:hypothetical protein
MTRDKSAVSTTRKRRKTTCTPIKPGDEIEVILTKKDWEEAQARGISIAQLLAELTVRAMKAQRKY